MRYLVVCLTLLTLGLSACTTEDSGRRVHEPQPSEVELFVSTLKEKTQGESQEALLKYYYENKVGFLSALEKDDYDAYTAIVKPLEIIYFSEKYVTSRDHNDPIPLQSGLHLFNKGILKMIAQNHELVITKDKTKNLLFRYYSAVRMDCSNGRNLCNSMSFFALDRSQSYKVTFALSKLMVHEFQTLENLETLAGDVLLDKLKGIFEAFEVTLTLKGRHQDLEFDSQFLAFQISIKTLIESKQNASLSEEYKELTARYQRLNGLMSVSVALQNKDSAEYKEFLISLSPLSCSQKRSAQSQYCSESLFEDAVKYLLVDYSETEKTLGELYDKEKENGQLLVLRDLEQLLSAQKVLYKIESEDFTKLDKVIFVLVDRFFSEKWSETQATLVWAKLLRLTSDRDKLVASIGKVVQLYARTVVLSQSNKTLRYFRDSFNREDLYVQDRFQNMLNEGDVPSRQWADIVERFSIFNEFLKKQLVRSRMRTSEMDKLLENLKTLPQNLKSVMVFPTMAIYSALLRGNKFENISTFDGRQVDYDEVAPLRLLIGRTTPWFLLGTNTDSINYSETILSTYLLFKNSFISVTSEKYPEDFVNKEMASKGTESLDHSSVMKYLIEDLFLGDLRNFNNYYIDLVEHYSQNHYNKFKFACDKIKSNQPIDGNPFLLDLSHSIIVGKETEGLFGAFKYFYFEDSTKYKQFFQLRSILKRKLRLVELLRVSYHSYLYDLKQAGALSATEYEQATIKANKSINDSLKKIHDMTALYGGTFFRGHEAFTDCMYPILKREFATQKYLKTELEAYAKKVYLTMAEKRGILDQVKGQESFVGMDLLNIDPSVRLVGTSGSEYVHVGALNANGSLTTKYQSKSNMITSDVYRASKVDMLLVIKHSLENMSAEDQKVVGARIKVSMPPNLNEIPLIKEPSAKDIVSIPFNEDYTTFKNDFFKAIFRYSDDKDYYLGWVGLPSQLGFLKNRLNVISEYLLISHMIKMRDGICESSGRKDCEIEREKIVNSDILFKEYSNIRELLHIDPNDEEEKSFLRNLGRSSRFPIEIIRDLFFEDQQESSLTYMEKEFDRLSDEILPRLKWGGTTSESTIPIGLGFITRFYVQQRDSQQVLFDKSEYMKDQLRSMFRVEVLENLDPAVEVLNNLSNIDCYLEPLVYNTAGDQVGKTIEAEAIPNVPTCSQKWGSLSEANEAEVVTLTQDEQKVLREAFLKDERVDDFKSFVRENFYKTTDCEYVTTSSDDYLKDEARTIETFFELEAKETCKK